MAIQPAAIRPIVRPAARPVVAPRAAAPVKAQGILTTGGKIAGGLEGGFVGFGVSAVAAIFLTAEKIMRGGLPGWALGLEAAGILGSTVLGAFAGSKLMGGIGSKVEQIVKNEK